MDAEILFYTISLLECMIVMHVGYSNCDDGIVGYTNSDVNVGGQHLWKEFVPFIKEK